MSHKMRAYIYLGELGVVPCRPIPELTMVVFPRAPQTAILLHRQAEGLPCSHSHHPAIDHLKETVVFFVDARCVASKLMIFVRTRGPQTAISVQQQAVDATGNQGLRLASKQYLMEHVASATLLPELTRVIATSDPHSTILRHHHTV